MELYVHCGPARNRINVPVDIQNPARDIIDAAGLLFTVESAPHIKSVKVVFNDDSFIIVTIDKMDGQ